MLLQNSNSVSFLVLTGYPGFQAATYTSRSYAGITPGYTYQFPGNLRPTLPQSDRVSRAELTFNQPLYHRYSRVYSI